MIKQSELPLVDKIDHPAGQVQAEPEWPQVPKLLVPGSSVATIELPFVAWPMETLQ